MIPTQEQPPVADSAESTDSVLVGRRRPGRPRSEVVEQAILDAALRLLADEGIAGLSIEAVAQRAGVAKTTIYRRWGNKCDLLVDAIAHLKGPLPVPPGNGVRDDLVWLLQRCRKQSRGDLAVRIMPRLVADADEASEDLLTACRRKAVAPRREVTKNVLRRGIDEGIIRPDIDLDLVVEMLIAPILISRACRGERHSDAEVEQMVDLILQGIAPRSL